VTVELNPEAERIVQEEVRRGRFGSVEEAVQRAVYALQDTSITAPPRKPRKNLADFLMESPFAGSEIDLEREQDFGRPVEL
jgi:Arc/MetJ-type ribon-helix-helix transcriptional regulator